jgi:hypothetical protein
LRRAAAAAWLICAAHCAPSDFDRFHLIPEDLAATAHDLARADQAGSDDLGAVDLSPTPTGDLLYYGCDAMQCLPWTVAGCGACGTKTCSTGCRWNYCVEDSPQCACNLTICCYHAVCAANAAPCTQPSDCCSNNCAASPTGGSACACAPPGSLLNYAAIVHSSYACCSGSSSSTAVDCQFQCN